MNKKIENYYKQYIQNVLGYDFELYHELQNSRSKLADLIDHELKKRQQLKIVIDRKTYFEATLKESSKQQEITQTEKEAIISYVERSLIGKVSMAVFFDGEIYHPGLPTKENSIWIKIYDIGKEIDSIENEKLTVSGNMVEYVKLSNNLYELDKSYSAIKEKMLIIEKKISQAFMPNFTLNVDELNELCKNTERKKTELLVLEDRCIDLDGELALVIQMRAKKASDKGGQLVVMPFEEFDTMMEGAPLVQGVTKLSFLHHGSFETGYVSEISKYIDHLPDLNEIILRGCGTANKPLNKLSVYEAKITNVSYDQKPSIQGATQLVIQQKEDEQGKILTKVSWMTIEPKSKKLVCNTIENIENLPKLSGKKPSDEQLTLLERIPGMPLLQHSSTYISSLKTTFFNYNQPISSEMLANAKKAIYRARTETGLTRADTLSEVLDKMTLNQKAKISVKAYVGGYKVSQGRVIPTKEHDHENEPKAVRSGPKPP